MTDTVGMVGRGIRNLFAKAPVPYFSSTNSWFGGLSRGEKASELAAMGANGTLFSIINRTSTSTAAPRWHLYRSAASGLDEDRVDVTKHQALKIWNRPNDFFTGQLFRETFMQHFDLTGECYWVVERSSVLRSIPLGMWPVRPDRMEPVPSKDDYLQGWVYTGPSGEKVPLELDEVIQLRMPNPLDPYRGMGPVGAILVDLESARFASEYNRRFFLNSAQPSGVINVNKRLSDTEWRELSERWGENHKGVRNAHRVGILEGENWKYEQTGYSMKDMQFAELYGLSSKVIREAFGMPKFAVGDVDDVNRATADASKAWFAEALTVPRLNRIKDALNTMYLPMFGTAGEGVEFDYENPVPPDIEQENATRESKANAYKTLVDAGVDPDDAARVAGLPQMRRATQQIGVPA